MHPNSPLQQTSQAVNGPSAGVMIEDLVQGLNQWRNIQDVVRLTFKAFHDVLRSQGETIKSLERSLDNKINKTDMAATLQQKANSNDVMAKLREIDMQLFSKADTVDMERRALKSDVEASFRTHMSDVYTVLNSKSEASELKLWREQTERQVSQLRGDLVKSLQRIEEIGAALDSKTNIRDVYDALSTKVDTVDFESKLRDKVSKHAFSEALARKSDTIAVESIEAEFRQGLADLAVGVARKADMSVVEDLSGRVERLRAQVRDESDTLASGMRALGAACDASFAELRNRVSAVSEATSATATQLGTLATGVKAHEELMRDILPRKVDEAVFESIIARKAEATAVDLALAGKAAVEDVRDLDAGVEDLKERLRQLTDALEGLVDEEALQQSLETKAETADVNQALEEVCAELELRVKWDELEKAGIRPTKDDVEFGQGRWLWNSNTTKAAGAIPWNEEVLNTAADNFVWHPHRATLMVVNPGVYEVSVAVFSQRACEVQLLVNGSIAQTVTAPDIQHRDASGVYTSISSPRQIAANSKQQHNLNNSLVVTDDVLSNSLQDFGLRNSLITVDGSAVMISNPHLVNCFMLPLKAKLVVVYHGNMPAQGVISIRRLQ